jgi:hypothetical protein
VGRFSIRDFIIGIGIGSLLFSGVSHASSYIKLIVNGREIQTDVPPQVIDGRTMIPARFLAESLGAKVTWDSNKNAVVVTSKQSINPPVLNTQYLTIPLLHGWTVETGSDSYTIKDGDIKIASLNTLGYDPNLSSLLPNGSEILENKEVEGTSVKTISVKLITRSSINGSETANKEIHYLYYIEGNKLVYDLSFNLDLVEEDKTLSVAQNAIVN